MKNFRMPLRFYSWCSTRGAHGNLAGKVNAMGKEYFEKEIEPYLDNSNIEYVGELNDVEKREFLKNSMGVLFPSTWDEPFGLVIIEAMACGVPVIGFPVGAVPEIIRHGENGLAGKVNAMGKEYFEKEIEPYLDNSNIEYVGELNDVEKREFLKNSMGVLFPSTWDEPFGLVIIEAMACGVPVIGFPVGAVPEIIRHGENGFIAKDVNEMCSYTKQLSNIDAQTCHQYVVNNFSVERMANEYEAVFNKILNTKL